MVIYRLLADFIVGLHAVYVAFVVVGQAAVIYGLIRRRSWARNFWFRGLHLLAIAVVVALSWTATDCPLTTLENSLRDRAGQTAYPGDFIAYWVRELLFYQCASWVFVLAYSLFGVIVLVTFLLAPPGGPAIAVNFHGEP